MPSNHNRIAPTVSAGEIGDPQLRRQTAQAPQCGIKTARLIRAFASKERSCPSSTRQPLIQTFPYKPPCFWRGGPKAGSAESDLVAWISQWSQ